MLTLFKLLWKLDRIEGIVKFPTGDRLPLRKIGVNGKYEQSPQVVALEFLDLCLEFFS